MCVCVFSLLVSAESWPSLLAMLDGSPKAVLGLGVRVCGPLSAMVVQQPTLSDRAVLVMEVMTDEALSALPSEVRTYCMLQRVFL